MILISRVHFSALWLLLSFQTASSARKDFIKPEDIETASEPFAEKYLYVDKTGLALTLFERVRRKYFFARPSGFGKTTFLRTLQGIFDGRGRKIFNYTHIHRSNYSWDSYPVLYLDLRDDVIETDETCNELMKTSRSLTKLEKKVDTILTKFQTMHKLSKPKETRLPSAFASVLTEIRANGNLTVVLIDDYDFSIQNNMNKCPKAARINTELIRNIFLVLKDLAGLVRFAFVTGIRKFESLGITTMGSAFDLHDITGGIYWHDIAGLTESDLDNYYSDHFAAVSNMTGKPKDNITSELKHWYNGYKFSSYAPSPLYNPSSVHSYLTKGEAERYWADKPTVQFLFEQMIKLQYGFSGDPKEFGMTSDLLGRMEEADLLYDAGYITIHDFKNGNYILKFPNLEMEEAYYKDIAETARTSENSTDPEIRLVAASLMKPVPDFHGFMYAIIRGIMKLPIRPGYLEWYRWQIMLLMKAAGIPNVKGETKFDISRKTKFIDLTGYSDDVYFLFKCKLLQVVNFDAWAAVRESIPAFLEQNIKKTKPLMLLAAGITFSFDFGDIVKSDYQAKLIFPNGTVHDDGVYDSADVPNKATDFYREESYHPNTFKQLKRPYRRQNASTMKQARKKKSSPTVTTSTHI